MITSYTVQLESVKLTSPHTEEPLPTIDLSDIPDGTLGEWLPYQLYRLLLLSKCLFIYFRCHFSFICSTDHTKECCVSMDDSWSTSWGGLLCTEDYQEEPTRRCGRVYDGDAGSMVEG